ncbi:hypothetical protein PAHAL_4G097000 [Panicum hallii]|uniref:Hydrophobic seed protein domain-containing protein n=1 Tax=Panicum hallii TaxID=206008 RepID=A0A2S3HIB3_9POAL|nr:hypothetical protein PAHAL_4G097000 [Panicum hallii]
MASSAKTARLLLLLQIALFVASAVIMSGGSVCHGARDGYGGFHPDLPACIGERCPVRPGYPYGHRLPNPYGRPGRGGIPYHGTPAQPPNGEIPRP